MAICSRYHNKFRAGFSLIELLVAVTIVAVLLSLLMPLIGRLRDHARQTRCLANTRQLATAFLAYAADNDGAIPQGWATTNAHLNWCVSTEPYLDGLSFRRTYGVKSTRRPFGCTTKVLGSLRADGLWNMGDGNGYGINVWPAWDQPGGSAYVAGADNPGAGIHYRTFRLAHIVNPSNRVWGGDANGDEYGRDYTRTDGSSWKVWPPSGPPPEARRIILKSPTGGVWNADIGQRHPNGQVNVTFFDGRARTIGVQQLVYGLFRTTLVE